MKNLSEAQRLVLAEFCGNFAVAWLAAGIVGPIIVERTFIIAVKPVIMSIIWASMLLFVMLYLTRRIER